MGILLARRDGEAGIPCLHFSSPNRYKLSEPEAAYRCAVFNQSHSLGISTLTTTGNLQQLLFEIVIITGILSLAYLSQFLTYNSSVYRFATLSYNDSQSGAKCKYSLFLFT